MLYGNTSLQTLCLLIANSDSLVDLSDTKVGKQWYSHLKNCTQDTLLKDVTIMYIPISLHRVHYHSSHVMVTKSLVLL